MQAGSGEGISLCDAQHYFLALCHLECWEARGRRMHGALCRRAQLAEVLYLTTLEELVWDGALAQYVLGKAAVSCLYGMVKC